MVIALDDQTALTPAGKPLTPVTLLLVIPVAPVIACVILVNGELIHNVGADEATPTVLSGRTVIVPVALTLPHPPVNGIE